MAKFRLNDVPRNPDFAVAYIIDFLSENFARYYNSSGVLRAENQVEFIYLITVFTKAIDMSLVYKKFRSEMATWKEIIDVQSASFDNPSISLKELLAFLGRIEGVRKVNDLGAHFFDLETKISYSINSTDIDKIDILINECKKIIKDSSILDNSSKKVLLNYLEKIQKELSGQNGRLENLLENFDKISDALEKFGKKIKPLTDRIREIRGLSTPNSEQKTLPAPKNKKSGQIEGLLIPRFNTCRKRLGLKTRQLINLLSRKLEEKYSLIVPDEKKRMTKHFLAYVRQNVNENDIIRLFEEIEKENK